MKPTAKPLTPSAQSLSTSLTHTHVAPRTPPVCPPHSILMSMSGRMPISPNPAAFLLAPSAPPSSLYSSTVRTPGNPGGPRASMYGTSNRSELVSGQHSLEQDPQAGESPGVRWGRAFLPFPGWEEWGKLGWPCVSHFLSQGLGSS